MSDTNLKFKLFDLILIISIGQCLGQGNFYDDGEEYQSQCHNCKCEDGTIRCLSVNCPELECSREDQIKIDGECCPYCKGMPAHFQ